MVSSFLHMNLSLAVAESFDDDDVGD